jgi:hypothetical protein
MNYREFGEFNFLGRKLTRSASRKFDEKNPCQTKRPHCSKSIHHEHTPTAVYKNAITFTQNATRGQPAKRESQESSQSFPCQILLHARSAAYCNHNKLQSCLSLLTHCPIPTVMPQLRRSALCSKRVALRASVNGGRKCSKDCGGGAVWRSALPSISTPENRLNPGSSDSMHQPRSHRVDNQQQQQHADAEKEIAE